MLFRSFDITKYYSVVTSDYLFKGGGGMTFFAKAIHFVDTGKKIREAVIEYLNDEMKKGNSITVKKDGRIQAIE